MAKILASTENIPYEEWLEYRKKGIGGSDASVVCGVNKYRSPIELWILDFTYGIMVFQEQLIEIGRLAKIHNPDLLRKAIGKKNPKLLAQVKPELEEKLKQRGWHNEQFESLWSQMLEFAKYSFNKAHSSAYAIIAYVTAKQKAYYPAEFYAGLCNSYIGKSSFVKDNAEEIITDLEEHNIKIEPFNFRNDHRRCSVRDGKIIYGIEFIQQKVNQLQYQRMVVG